MNFLIKSDSFFSKLNVFYFEKKSETQIKKVDAL